MRKVYRKNKRISTRNGLLLMILLFGCLTISGQQTIRFVKGDNVPISGVHVSVFNGEQVAVSNKRGYAVVPVTQLSGTEVFVCTHIAYDTLIISTRDLDTKQTFTLIPRKYELPVFKAVAGGPEPMFHSSSHYVADYEVLGDYLVLLTFSQSLKKDAALTLTNHRQQILHEMNWNEEAVELIRDYKNRLYLKTLTKLYAIRVVEEKLQVNQVDFKQFKSNIQPCIDSAAHFIFFSDYVEHIPRMNYYAFNALDSSVFKIREVQNEIVNKMYRREREYSDETIVSIDDKRKARKIAEFIPNMDKRDVVAMMTGFNRSIYYEPVYAPLFVQEDTILIFDHSSNWLYRYRSDFSSMDSLPIDYHHSESFFKWKRKVLHDEKEQEFYALFLKRGYYILKSINLISGSVKSDFKLNKQFVENIKIDNGYVYYLYKPVSSSVKPFLYRELLTQQY